MGISYSKPEPRPEVDLLPPRFDRRSGPLERLPLSPFEYMFGQEKRDRLFSSNFAAPDAFSFKGSMRPDYEQKAMVGLSASLPMVDPRTVTDASIFNTSSVLLGYEDVGMDPMFLGQARIGADGSARACISGYDAGKGIGAYALMPMEALLAADNANSIQGVGAGVAGNISRYTHLKMPVTEDPTRPQGSVANDMTSPKSVSGPAAESSGVFGTSSSARKAVLPELGLRYISADERFSLGVHGAPMQPYPVKVWMVGSVNGVLNAGVQCSSDISHVLANPSTAPFSVDAAVSLQQPPLYELSLALDGKRQEIVAGYVQNMTMRRKVYNVFEKSEVKGIYNYLDWGFELRRPLKAPGATSLAVGASWQANKNLLFKGRLGTRDGSVSASFKSWWDPAITFTATGTYDRAKNSTGVGLFLSLEQGGALDYQKAIQGYQTTPQTLTLATEAHVSESRSRTVDPNPYAPPPAGARAPVAVSRPPSMFL